MTPSDALGGSSAPQSSEAAPAVVAVVVTCNAGSWFTETLEALRDQDYPNLSVLIIDAASAEDPLERIVETLPGAYVRRLSRNPGYAAASNRVLRILQGADYLVMCHDDIAPAPDAFRRMVEEALRTNAGVVTPKMVEWLRPDRLIALGGGVDVTAAFVPEVEPGDLDQGQHDSPGEVFVAPGGCMLVRADLFTSLGGFDPAMTLQGEDVDFSWRAHVVGARVVTAASARVRHLEAANNGWRMMGGNSESIDEDEAGAHQVFDKLVLQRRHRLRTVLKVRRRWRLVSALFQLMILSLGEIIYGFVSGKSQHAGAVVAAWTWNLAHWRDVRKLRRQLKNFRTVSDREIATKLVGTRGRVEDLLVAELESWREKRRIEREERSSRDFAGRIRHLPLAVWATVLVVWLVGSRHILAGDMPSVGQITPLMSGPVEALKQFSGMLPSKAWGDQSLQSPAYLMLSILSAIFFGAVGTLQRVLVLGALPFGIWGMVRLVKRLKSPRARLMAVVAYAAVPLPYDSLGLGRWDGLIAYAFAPFLLHRLLRSSGMAPWIDRTRIEFLRRRSALLDDDDLEMLVLSENLLDEGESAAPAKQMRAASALLAEREVAIAAAAIESVLTDRVSVRDRFMYTVVSRIVPLGLVAALGALLAPQLLIALLVTAGALAVGSLLTAMAWREAARLAGVAVGGLVVALILVLPAILGSDSGWHGLWRAPMSSVAPTGLGAFLRFYVGGSVPAFMTFGLLIAALPGVLIGNAWRLNVSLRLWITTLTLVGITWAGAHDWLGGWHADPHVFLAMAGATVALNAAIGVVAVQQDLRSHSFGWRQLAPFVMTIGVAMAIIPVASRAGTGTWDLPSISSTQLLTWMDAQKAQGSFRVLWLGDGDAMPGGARWVSDDLSAAVSVDGALPAAGALPSKGGDGQSDLAHDVAVARQGNTVQLGKLLAPYSVRYIVVPNRTGANGSSGKSTVAPADLTEALSSQLDLSVVNTDASLSVYENKAYMPVRAALSAPDILAAHSTDPDSALSVDLNQASPVLPNGDGRTWTGGLSQEDVYVAEDGSSAWRLKVGGHEMQRQEAFGWASTFSVGRSGQGELHFIPSLWIPALQVVNAVLWLVAFGVAVRYRARRGRWA